MRPSLGAVGSGAASAVGSAAEVKQKVSFGLELGADPDGKRRANPKVKLAASLRKNLAAHPGGGLVANPMERLGADLEAKLVAHLIIKVGRAPRVKLAASPVGKIAREAKLAANREVEQVARRAEQIAAKNAV